MSIANCPRCGKVFNKVSGTQVCPACLEREEEAFQKVYNFLKENVEATVPEIQFATEVDEKLIRKFLEEGRLMGTGAKLSTACASCGAHISMGRFCSACLAKKRDAFKGVTGPAPGHRATSAPISNQSQDSDVVHQLRTDKYLR